MVHIVVDKSTDSALSHRQFVKFPKLLHSQLVYASFSRSLKLLQGNPLVLSLPCFLLFCPVIFFLFLLFYKQKMTESYLLHGVM